MVLFALNHSLTTWNSNKNVSLQLSNKTILRQISKKSGEFFKIFKREMTTFARKAEAVKRCLNKIIRFFPKFWKIFKKCLCLSSFLVKFHDYKIFWSYLHQDLLS